MLEGRATMGPARCHGSGISRKSRWIGRLTAFSGRRTIRRRKDCTVGRGTHIGPQSPFPTVPLTPLRRQVLVNERRTAHSRKAKPVPRIPQVSRAWR